jgi:hypothetical protein
VKYFQREPSGVHNVNRSIQHAQMQQFRADAKCSTSLLRWACGADFGRGYHAVIRVLTVAVKLPRPIV